MSITLLTNQTLSANGGRGLHPQKVTLSGARLIIPHVKVTLSGEAPSRGDSLTLVLAASPFDLTAANARATLDASLASALEVKLRDVPAGAMRIFKGEAMIAEGQYLYAWINHGDLNATVTLDVELAQGTLRTGAGTGDMLALNNLSDLVDAAAGRTNLGLGNVDNTADLDKPISTAQQAALDAKVDPADLAGEAVLRVQGDLARLPLPALSDAALGTIRPVAAGGYARLIRSVELQTDAEIFGTQSSAARNFPSMQERLGVFGDHIRYYLYSAGLADFTYAEWRDVVPLYLGQLHTFTLTNAQDGTVPTLNVDGVDLPAPFVASSGSPVAWDEPLTATYLTVGQSWITSTKVKRISDFVAFNQALSGAEIAQRLTSGELVKPDERDAKTTLYDWSGGLGSQGWSNRFSSNIAAYDTVADPDGIGTPPNGMGTILKVTTTVQAGGIVGVGLPADRLVGYDVALLHPTAENGTLRIQNTDAMAQNESTTIPQGTWWHNAVARFRRNTGQPGLPLIYLLNDTGTFYVALRSESVLGATAHYVAPSSQLALQMPNLHPEGEPAATPAGSPTVASREPFTHHDHFTNSSGVAQNYALTDQPENSIIDAIIIDVVSGSATYAIGTSSGGGQVAATQAGGRLTLSSDIFAGAQRALHLAVSADSEVVVSTTVKTR